MRLMGKVPWPQWESPAFHRGPREQAAEAVWLSQAFMHGTHTILLKSI